MPEDDKKANDYPVGEYFFLYKKTWNGKLPYQSERKFEMPLLCSVKKM
jgi:hypothetical protein